ncbi:ankyrin repeat domain-containing protein [Bacillus sp. RO2]|uniref:ankyrin repeat domain-containing protein n=1 Tax=Bacillus sp. RO2 TaxID=2723913 RepID=UPI00145DA69D|nr:ankyrin repeat domain-containing protein [Bacillus sp. RO2]NMH73909.1 ankyrin repeat domain-containing protein [Bacillus sp. RO2]
MKNRKSGTKRLRVQKGTALIRAARNTDFAAVELLVERSTNVTLKNNYGETAVDKKQKSGIKLKH